MALRGNVANLLGGGGGASECEEISSELWWFCLKSIPDSSLPGTPGAYFSARTLCERATAFGFALGGGGGGGGLVGFVAGQFKLILAMLGDFGGGDGL